MSDFMAKMHQIRFSPGLRPTPRYRNLQLSPDPPAVYNGAASKRTEGVEGRKGKGGKERG